MRSEFDELKRFAIADVLSVSGKEKTTSTIEKHIDNIIDVAIAREQNQQSKIDELQKQRDSFIKAYEIEVDESVELQKRVDKALKMLDQFYCEGNLDSLEKAEQALKGGGE